MSILLQLVYILIFPGFLFSIVIGLLLIGIDRKMVARMQRRIGPPILQPFYDLIKLMGKKSIIPRKASQKAFIIAPLVGLASVIAIMLFIPIYGYNFEGNTADIIVIIYLLTIPAIALIVGGSSSGSPYAGVGISREMVTMISYELPLVIILLAVGAKAGLGSEGGRVTFSLATIQAYQSAHGIILLKWSMIPAALAFLLIIPAEVGTVPFDVAEAETEICEGPLVEYSGFYLGAYKLTQSVKLLVMSSLFVALFMGGSGFNNLALNTVLLVLLSILITVISVSFVRSVVGRIKIEHTLKFFWTIPTALATISLILAYLKL